MPMPNEGPLYDYLGVRNSGQVTNWLAAIEDDIHASMRLAFSRMPRLEVRPFPPLLSREEEKKKRLFDLLVQARSRVSRRLLGGGSGKRNSFSSSFSDGLLLFFFHQISHYPIREVGRFRSSRLDGLTLQRSIHEGCFGDRQTHTERKESF
ncbi:hypothetical protein FRC18_008229 [Serendipita sp. 400]|nr:hypothetical protein FRC18_008229 [Serendipita sp. 400]